MRKTWRLLGISESYDVSRRSDLASEGENDAGARLAALNIDRWLADPFMQRAMMEMYESVAGFQGAAASRSRGSDLHRYVKPPLLAAFRRGEFVFLRAPHDTIIPVGEEKKEEQPAEEGQSPAPPPQRKKTWIEVELVDDDDRPVPNARFQLELPDGRRKSGTLDGDGRARVSDIDPGLCRVSFPDFDASEWEAA